MSDSSNPTKGFLSFFIMFLVVLTATISFQKAILTIFIDTLFPNYVLTSDVLPHQWIVMNKDLASGADYTLRRENKQKIFELIVNNGFDPTDPQMNELRGKRALREFTSGTNQTLYFINPYVAILPLHLFFAMIVAFLLSLFMPSGSPLGWVHKKLMREYKRLELLLRKQFMAHDVEFNNVLSMNAEEREEYIRNSTLPEVITTEVEDYMAIDQWVQGKTSNPLTPIRFFFRYKISSQYGNIIQGLVSGGAAILIFVIGLRGLKLIPAEEPSLILMALSIEFILLIILMFTFAGSAQEERLDRIMKELEAEQRDAIKQQTATIHQVLDQTTRSDPASLTNDSLAEHEERRILDELLSAMLTESTKNRRPHGTG